MSDLRGVAAPREAAPEGAAGQAPAGDSPAGAARAVSRIDLGQIKDRAVRYVHAGQIAPRAANGLAHACASDVPALVAEVERLRELLHLAARFTVNAAPMDLGEAVRALFDVRVEYAGCDRWAVRRGAHRCLDSAGRWEWEPIPSEREDGWLGEHRFDLDRALELARRVAPDVSVNGVRAGDAR